MTGKTTGHGSLLSGIMACRRSSWISLAATAAALGGSAAPALLPAFDRRDALASLRRLQRSPTPQARAIARQIVSGPRDLALQRAAARREGLPLTPVQLQAGAPPEALNAAPVYARLM